MTEAEKQELAVLLETWTKKDGSGLKGNISRSAKARIAELRAKGIGFVRPDIEGKPNIGEPWIDEQGRKHSGNCNAHPAKTQRCLCDCGAMKGVK